TIATKDVGNADVISVRAFSTSGSKPLPVELRFTNLDLRWAEHVGERQIPEQHSRGWLLAAVIVVAVIGLSIAGALLIARSRAETISQPFLTFQCPACQRKMKTKVLLAGKKVKCPHCAAAIDVPSREAGLPDAHGHTIA